MNLQYFPMDRQLCYIEIESCEYFRFEKKQIRIPVIQQNLPML